MLFKRRRERNREKEKIKKGHRNYIKTKTNQKKTIGTKLITNTKKLKLKISFRRLGLLFWVPDVLCWH